MLVLANCVEVRVRNMLKKTHLSTHLAELQNAPVSRDMRAFATYLKNTKSNVRIRWRGREFMMKKRSRFANEVRPVLCPCVESVFI